MSNDVIMKELFAIHTSISCKLGSLHISMNSVILPQTLPGN